MSVQTETPIAQRRRNRKGYNIYCLFGSQQTLNIFHSQRNKRMSVELLRKTNQTETNAKEPSKSNSKDQKQQKMKQQEPKGSTVRDAEVPKLRCEKCMKLLLQQQNEKGLCCECVRMWKTIENGNFSKFIRFVIDFKRNKLPQYKSIGKVKRIESIESCQSFILDKPDSSTKHSQIKFKHNNKQSHRLKNSNNESNRFKIGKISVGSLYKQNPNDNSSHLMQSGGYFCNECQASPIKGQVFHCLKCSDYDLCQKCYFYTGHKHEMKVIHESRNQQIKKAKENALMQSQSIKKALPLLSQSIQRFQSIPKLYTSYKIKIPS